MLKDALAIRTRWGGGFARDEFGVDFDGGAFGVVGDDAGYAVDDELGREAADFVRFLPHRGEGRVHRFGEVEVGETDDGEIARD